MEKIMSVDSPCRFYGLFFIKFEFSAGRMEKVFGRMPYVVGPIPVELQKPEFLEKTHLFANPVPTKT
jgi:hypothetical protein